MWVKSAEGHESPRAGEIALTVPSLDIGLAAMRQDSVHIYLGHERNIGQCQR